MTPEVAREAGLGVGPVAGVARLVMPRGVKCLALTDNPPGFHVGIALARLQGNTSRLVERFTEHALRFSTATDVTPPPAAQPSAG